MLFWYLGMIPIGVPKPLARLLARSLELAMPISLTDDEMTLITDAARPLAVKDRDPFLGALANELAKYPAVGPGLIHRLIRETQGKFFDPPNLNDGSKYG